MKQIKLKQGKAQLVWRKQVIRLLTEKAESEGLCLQAYCKLIGFEHELKSNRFNQHSFLKGPDAMLTHYAESLACLLGKSVLAIPGPQRDPNTCSSCLTTLDDGKIRKLRPGQKAYVWRKRVTDGLQFKADQAGLTLSNYCYRIGFWMGANKSNQDMLLTRYAKALVNLLGEGILVSVERASKTVLCSACKAKGALAYEVQSIAVNFQIVKPLPPIEREPAEPTPIQEPVEKQMDLATLSPFERMVLQRKAELERNSQIVKARRQQELADLAKQADLMLNRRRKRVV